MWGPLWMTSREGMLLERVGGALPPLTCPGLDHRRPRRAVRFMEPKAGRGSRKNKLDVRCHALLFIYCIYLFSWTYNERHPRTTALWPLPGGWGGTSD